MNGRKTQRPVSMAECDGNDAPGCRRRNARSRLRWDKRFAAQNESDAIGNTLGGRELIVGHQWRWPGAPGRKFRIIQGAKYQPFMTSS